MNLKERMRNAGSQESLVPANTPPPASHDQSPAKETASALEREWKHHIHQKLLKVIDLSLVTGLEEKQARTQIREVVNRLMIEESVPLPAATRQRLVTQIEDEILGLGPLEPLLADPSVSDILVNGHDSVYVERHGKIKRTEVQFRDDAHLRNIIDRIVSNVGRRIDESSPMVDARLKDGSRVNVIIPPLAIDGPMLSIRRFSVYRPSTEDLIEYGSITAMIAEVISAIVKARLNVLISGGTGSGKTTLLNVLSGFIPHNERIVTIEDSAELQLQQPHVVRLETRPPNIENKGEVTQRDLVRNSLRMRPDRIIVGEVRGAEALDMLQAMNTGHDGSLTTIHANSPRDALSRLETMVTMAGFNLPIRAMRAQMASAIHIVIQLERMEDGKRRVVSLQEIQGMEGDVITMSEIFKFHRQGIDGDGNVQGRFQSTGLVPKFHERLRQRGIELDFDLFDPDRQM
ncbi:type II secretion system protein E [Nitrosococcus halophilus Nc 4]|uniref:Type II secretion system protein E n=1 Tax=Nitrosococcus halophilus (strain Nc4) TaxID=472759 RepID=D5C120_NITHN|nr:CpaF family protein [Nitrosococcus halophilus]ADE14577.1 type II secretion system protein E [Nitrosococcus halophilus Nc 4]